MLFTAVFFATNYIYLGKLSDLWIFYSAKTEVFGMIDDFLTLHNSTVRMPSF